MVRSFKKAVFAALRASSRCLTLCVFVTSAPAQSPGGSLDHKGNIEKCILKVPMGTPAGAIRQGRISSGSGSAINRMGSLCFPGS